MQRDFFYWLDFEHAQRQTLFYGARTWQCMYGISWQKAGSTIALANGDAVRRAVPVRAQLRLPGKVAHVINAVVLEALHKIAGMHVRDDDRVDLPLHRNSNPAI